MKLDFNKNKQGLLPAIIQDHRTRKVLMMGYMNQEAYNITRDTGLVTFYSRSRKQLWKKGEESGNILELVTIKPDCDGDTLLVQVRPAGPTCHTGTDTCWGESNEGLPGFLGKLEARISDRKENPENSESYVASLFREGINKIAQKVGEEAVELVIEAKDEQPELFLNESADLLFHFLVLLKAKGHSLRDVIEVLEGRH